jgi:hypothetical protein
MKCPNCDYSYRNGWNNDGEFVAGKYGPFWDCGLELRRNIGRDWGDDGRRGCDIFGCPKCKYVFHDGD